MGDRCYMTLTMGGHIETESKLQEIVSLLDDDAASITDYPGPKGQTLREYILRCALHGQAAEFGFDEVNYADLPCFNALAELGLDLHAHNGSGGGYEAGNQSYNSDTGEHFEWLDGEEGRIDILELEKTLANDCDDAAKLDRIRDLLAEVTASEWHHVGAISVAEHLSTARWHTPKGTEHLKSLMQNARCNLPKLADQFREEVRAVDNIPLQG